ncbi:MAG: radical SAM protein [Candidatus Bilamarchaeaceae archaeon]
MAVKIATIDIIGDCQNRCLFCYNQAKKGKIEFGHFKKLIEGHLSLERVNIGGGEPTLNSDLPRMVEFSVSRGLRTDISTNGLIYPKETVELAAKFPELLGLQVNLPAAEEIAFDNITRTKGNFKTVLGNIGKLAASELKPRLRLTLCKENLGQIRPVALLAKDLRLPLYVELAVPAAGNEGHILSSKEVEDAYLTVLQLKLANLYIHHRWSASRTNCPALAEAYGLMLEKSSCTAANGDKLYMDSAGNKKGCEFLA